nr:putative deoxyribonuclease TATDN1 isoform X2 [Coffea arabica]
MATIRMIDGMFKGIYNGKKYHVADIVAVLSRAWSVGVDRIIVTGGFLEESKEALAIAETDARLFCMVDVHPTRCKEFDESGDPEKHFQSLLSLTKEGVEKGKRLVNVDWTMTGFIAKRIQCQMIWGSVGESNAINIAKRIGFDEKIINCAQAWINKLTPQKVLMQKDLLHQ